MYPASITSVNNAYMVSFRDVPGAITWADSYDDAIVMAKYALLSAMEIYIEDNRIVPQPSIKKDDEVLISLTTSTSVKILLLNTMIKQRVSQSKLADLMGVQRQQITRLIDLKHTTRIDTLQMALNLLGKQIVSTLTDFTKQQLKEQEMNNLEYNTQQYDLPDEIALKSTIDKLMPIAIAKANAGTPDDLSKPNPFARKSQYEVINLLTDATPTEGFEKRSCNKDWQKRSLMFLSVLVPVLTFFTRNSALDYEPSIYLHHFDLLELERLAYNSGNDNIPTSATMALKAFLLSMPSYDITKIGNQSKTTKEAFGFMVMPVAGILGRYVNAV